MAYFASMIEIRHLDDTRVIQMEIPEGALVHRELMSDHYAKLPFATDTPIYFKLGDWCYLEGYGRFELTEPYLPKYNTQTGGYDYDLRLDAHYIKWKNKKVKYMPASAASETSFSLTANIDTHLNVIINNINALGEADSNYRYYGDPFTFEFRNFTGDRNAAFHKLYDNTDILSAIYDLADICDCEAWIEDNIICFGRCELSGQEVNFEIGVNVSEMSEADSKKDYATRLYVFGSTKNLPADYRKDNTADITQNGVVQKRLMLPLSLSPHGYIQDSGVTCETEAVEAVFVDESVYPKVECEVSTVIPYETNVTDSEGNVVYEEGHDGEEGHELKHIFYRIKDANGFRLIFDKDGEEIDLRLPGEQTRIVFQSGAMNGMDFECSYNKEDDYYEIIENEDYGRALPDGDLCPAVGDTFVIYGWDASQIESTDLISVAENRLHEVGLQKLAKLKIDPTVYTCTMDSDVYESSMRSQQGAYNHHDLGQKVKLINRAYFSAGRSSRVIGYEIKLDIPYDSPDYIIGEATRYSRSAEMENMQEQIESIAVNGVSYQGGGSGNGGVYIIGSTSSAPSSDYNVYSAKRTDKMFVRKDVNDTVYGRLTHEMQDIFKKGFKIGRFISGVLGSGALIDENGNLEVESIYARSFMSASEFRYNKVSVSDGEDLCTNGFGIIKAVDIDPETPTQGYITLQLEENDYASVEVGDICRGMYNDITGEHETADLDDDTPLYGVTGEQGDIGFPCKAGYFTSYFYVMDMTGEGCYNRKGECRFKYGLRNASVPHPCQFMKFAQYGNLFNTNRQSCIYKTSIGHSYEMVLEGVNTWKLSSANIVVRKGWLGDMYVTLHDGESETQLQGNGLYVQDNVYFGNAVIQLDPYTLAQLADELSTYSAEFSDYVDVITVDDVGNVIGGLYTESGEEGHEVRDYRIFSAITVRKRNELLTIAADNEDAGEGTYKINVLPHGCSCIVQNSTLYITGINNIKDGVAGSDDDDEFDYNAMRAVESCSVDVAINCEGKGTIIRKFPVTIKHDSQPFVGADIDNEFSAVSWNTKTQTYIGLPIVLNMKMWHNNEQLNIESVNDVSVSPAITGMTVSKEIINVSGQKHARVTISALPENLGNVTKLNITAIAEYAGVSYERTLTHTINKGTDVNVYSLLPSLSEIIYNKNTGALNSNSLSCKVMCDSTDDKHYEVTLDKLATHKLKLCYQIHYNDGTATTAETDYTSAGVTGLTIGVEKVVFKLYNLDKSVQYDEEGVPVIASGQDGKGVEYVFVLTTTNTAPTITSNADWTETVDGETVTHHVTDDDFRPMTSAGRATDEPTGTDSTNIFEWVAKRVKRFNNDGVLEWEPYGGTMSLWANWSKDGGTPETRYQWNQSPTSAPPLDAQNPSATTPDSNWNVSAPNRPGDGYYLWSVTAIKNYNNTYGTWGNFVRLTGDTGTPGEDGDEKEWIYGYSENGYAGNTGQVNPSGEASGSETNKNQPGWVPNGWTDHPRGVSNSHKTEYASWRDITNNGTTKSYGAFHTPIIWSHYGERGTDGDGTEYVFIRTKINTPPEVPSSGDYSEEEQGYDADEHLPYVFIFNAADISGSTTPVTPSGSAVKYVKCTDDPVGVNDEWKYEWVLKRTKAAPVGGVRSWEPYSGEMSLWAKYGDKGDPAHEIDINMLERTNFDRGLDAIKEAWVVTRDVWSKITVDSTLKVKGRSCVKIDGTDATDNYFDFEQSVLGKLKANTKYTLSFWGCNSTANRLQVFIFGDAYGSGSKLYQGKFWVDGVEVTPEDFNGCVMFAAAATPVYHTITFKTASTIPSRAEVWFRASQGTISYICMPKLEEGDTATAYIADEGDLIGPQGTSITGANVKYALADSGSTAPADSAFTSDDFPTTLNSGKYVWEATEITFSSGSPALTGKICLGPTTDFLAGTEVYAISTSNSTAPADNQFGTTYNKTKGYYLWTATRVQYTSGTYAYLNKKCVGYWGDDGTSPYQLKLSDEAALINCDENGNVLSSYELSRLMIQQGINSKFTDFNINIVPVGISCNGNSSSFSLSEETKASADSNGYYPLIPSAITVDAAEIRVIATLKTDSNFVLTGGYKINKNKTGATGKTGPSYYPAGEYDASTNNAFSRTDEMCPVVLSDGNYYYLKESSNLRNGSRISPTDQSYGSVYWGLCDNFQVVFIKALFAMFAKLGSFVVSGDWFISQYGTLVGPGTNNVVSIGSSNFETLYKISGSTISTGSGGKAAYAYFDGQDPECESAPTSGNMKFVPSLAIDAKSGTLIASNAKIRGDVKAISGQFGNLVISGNQISVQNGVFTIDSDGTTLQKRAKFAEAIFYKSTPVEITQTRALNLPSEASISAFLTNGTAFDGIHLTLPPAIEAYDGLEVRYLMGYSMGTRTTPGLYPAPLIIPSGTRIICLKSNRIIYGNNNGTVKFCMSEYKNTDYDLTDSYCKEVHLRCAMFVFYGGMTGPLSAEPVWLLLNEDDFKHTHYVLNPTTGQIVSVVDNDWFE